MASRVTMLMQVTTTPPNRADASPHTGGWSESFWANANLLSSDPDILVLCQKRANLLPAQASVVGFRLSLYNIVGNRLMPTGSSTGKLQLPGATSRITDVPQMALELSGKSKTSSNSTRFCVRCLPDAQVAHGEYQPDSAFKGLVTQYGNELVNRDWKFIGRDLTKPSIKVQSIAGNVVTLAAPLGVVDNVDWVRFRRVYDDDEAPVKGAYLVTAHAGNTITLAGFPARTMTTPSGTIRIDAIVTCGLKDIEPVRAVVRKVGRPFESYRGRQSKR